MSTRYIPNSLSCRGKKTQWMNLLAGIHDCHCECSHPITHTILLCFEQENTHPFTTPERDFLQKCLTGTVASNAAGDQGIDAFTGEELEKLFQEDTDADAASAG